MLRSLVCQALHDSVSMQLAPSKKKSSIHCTLVRARRALTRDHHSTSINTIPNFSILRSPHQKPRRRRRRRRLRGRHRGRPHDRHPSHGLRSSLPSVPNRQRHLAPWRVVALAIQHLQNSRLCHQHRGRLVEHRAGLQGPRRSLDRHHGED
jgi:hypothetical protein